MGLTAFNRHRRALAAEAARKAAAAVAPDEADELHEGEQSPVVDETAQNGQDAPETLEGGEQASEDTEHENRAQTATDAQEDASLAKAAEQAQSDEHHEEAAEADIRTAAAPAGADLSDVDSDQPAGAQGEIAATEKAAELGLTADIKTAKLTRGSSTGVWRDFAEAHGFTAGEAAELSRDELAEHFLGKRE